MRNPDSMESCRLRVRLAGRGRRMSAGSDSGSGPTRRRGCARGGSRLSGCPGAGGRSNSWRRRGRRTLVLVHRFHIITARPSHGISGLFSRILGRGTTRSTTAARRRRPPSTKRRGTRSTRGNRSATTTTSTTTKPASIVVRGLSRIIRQASKRVSGPGVRRTIVIVGSVAVVPVTDFQCSRSQVEGFEGRSGILNRVEVNDGVMLPEFRCLTVMSLNLVAMFGRKEFAGVRRWIANPELGGGSAWTLLSS